jgi:hypothetical protein
VVKDEEVRNQGEDNFLALGLSKGTVIFIDVQNLERVYARFSFHRQAINLIKELPKVKKFITTCEEMNIAVWGFSNNRS